MICTSAICQDMVLYMSGAMVGIIIRSIIVCFMKILRVNIPKMYEHPNNKNATTKHIVVLGTIQLAMIILIMQLLNLYYTRTSYFFMGLLTPHLWLVAF